jgi:hypothetical protein
VPLPDFYYQIKGRLPDEKAGQGAFGSNWDWPPIFCDIVEAANKKEAKLLIEEEYGRHFPLRVLTDDIDKHAFLLRITEVAPEDESLRRKFKHTPCKECGSTFRVIDKYNDPNEPDKGPDYCSKGCAQEGRIQRTKDYELTTSGRLPAVIYLIRQLSTGKCYVGQTIRPVTLRWWQHMTYPSENKFHQVLKSTPLTDWQFSILESIALADDHPNKGGFITDRERFWITEYDCISSGFNTILPTGLCQQKEPKPSVVHEERIS